MPAQLIMTNDLRQAVGVVKRDFTDKTPAGYSAKPYVEAILALPDGASAYHEEPLHLLLAYLISNLRAWRGQHAGPTKKYLRSL